MGTEGSKNVQLADTTSNQSNTAMSTQRTDNLLVDLPDPLIAASTDELFQQLAANATSGVRIERIVSNGHASAEGFWYDQDQHEWVMVVQGEAVLALDGQPDVRLKAGDYINIAAHTRHRVQWTSPDQTTVWLAVFY
jgi:cupin 2 domain-containing protein